jgi:hypothetical protein
MRWSGGDAVEVGWARLVAVPGWAILALGAGGAALALLGTWWAPPALDAALAALALALAGGSSAIGLEKRRLAMLPLALSPVALRGTLDGVRAWRFRVRLGRGRSMVLLGATVRFHGEDGIVISLKPVLPASARFLGALTLVVLDREGACAGPGRLQVEVSAAEGDRTWTAEGSWSTTDTRPGRFAADFVLVGGRLTPRPDTWDTVIPEDEA